MEKTSAYVLSIVGIVSVVAIAVLIIGGMGSNIIPSRSVESDVIGFAMASVTCTDTDSGFDYTTQGTISGGTWKTTGRTYSDKTDSCNARGQLQEGFCSDSTHGFYVFKYCDRVVGSGYVCEDGACVPESCTENLYLGESLTECEPTVESTSTFVFSQDDADAPVADMYLFVDYASGDEVYLADGDTYDEFTVDSIENDDYETIEFAAGSTSAELRFTNNDGTAVELPLAADSSYTSGEASDEPIFWGTEAPSSTTANQDELLYLEDETCSGSASVVDCQGAMFLVVDGDFNAHLLQITNIDTSSDTISFDDLTYGTADEDLSYTDGSISTISLTSETIALEIDESAMTIEFTTIGSRAGATIITENQGFFEIVNTDDALQTYEGIRFSENNDGSATAYLEEFEILAVYDDATDNSIELDRTHISALTSSEGYGLYDVSDTDDNSQVFMTYKGTLLTYNIENQLSMTIEHPENSVYAVVSVD